MVQTAPKTDLPLPFPDHTQLPSEDGTFVKNFQEHPQSILLTDSIGPILQQKHPDGQYAIGQDCGIYWRETEPPEKGAEAPDWFYIPDVPPLLNGEIRRSYVLRREFMTPLIALEFASGDGTQERDRTPLGAVREGIAVRPGKFWVYERIIHIPYYGIYEIATQKLEVYRLVDLAYQPLTANARGHYEISPLGVELGLWDGTYQNQTQIWLRWWDSEGNLLLIGDERAEVERQRAESERQRAESERQRAENERQEKEIARTQLRECALNLLQAGMDAETVARMTGLGLEWVSAIAETDSESGWVREATEEE